MLNRGQSWEEQMCSHTYIHTCACVNNISGPAQMLLQTVEVKEGLIEKNLELFINVRHE
jgi:hypothetical protein